MTMKEAYQLSSLNKFNMKSKLLSLSLWCFILCLGATVPDKPHHFSNDESEATFACPTISINSSPYPICVGGSKTLSASTTDGSASCVFQWQRSTSGSSGPWSDIPGANSNIYNTGSLSTNTWYRAKWICNENGCTDPISNIIQVTVIPDPSITLNGGGTICEGGSKTLSISGNTGYGCTRRWQQSTSGPGGPWSTFAISSSANSMNVSPTTTTWYRVYLTCSSSTGCNSMYSNIVSINVSPPSNVTLSGSGTICRGGYKILSFSNSGTTASCNFRWERSSSPSGPWSTVANGGTSYNTGGLISTTFYRVVKDCSYPGCSDVSNTVQVFVYPDPSIGITKSTPSTICSGGYVSLSVSYQSGGVGGCTISWQKSTSGSSGPWQTISGVTGTSYQTTLTADAWFRAVKSCAGSGCNTAFSNVIPVNVVPDPSANIYGPTTICEGGSSNLSANISYGTGCTPRWQRSTSGSGGPWETVATGSGYNTGPLSSTTWYRVYMQCSGGFYGCNSTYSNVLQVNVVPPSNVTVSGSGQICQGGNKTLNFSNSGGTGPCSYVWQRASSQSGPWTTVASGGSSYNTGPLSSTTFYRVVKNCDYSGCSDVSNIAQVAVFPDPTISISGPSNYTVCDGGSVNLNATGSGGTGACSVQWQYSTNGASGPWNDHTGATATSNAFNSGPLTTTTWFRATRTCTGSGCYGESNFVRVDVYNDPQILTAGGGTICTGGDISLGAFFTSAPSCSPRWQKSTTGPSGPWQNISGAFTLNFNTGILTTTTWYRVFVDCSLSGCGDIASNVQKVTVIPDPVVTIASGGMICEGGILSLSASASGTEGACSYQWQSATDPSGPWSSISGGGNGSLVTPVLTTTTYYRARTNCNVSGCTSNFSSPVEVEVVPDPTISISGGGTICPGDNVTLSPSISGGVGLCLPDWQKSTTGPNGPWSSDNNAPISGDYTTGPITSTIWYRAVVNCEGSGCFSISNVEAVIINDDTPPLAECKNIQVNLNANGDAQITGEDIDDGSSDNCGIDSYVASPNQFNCNNLGLNNVTLTVTDESNLTGTCTATVTVLDNTPPTADCQNLTLQLNGNGITSISPDDVDEGSSDVCGAVSLALSQTEFNCGNVGTTNITLTVTDGSGNSSTCESSIFINDTVDPTAFCQDITVELDAAGNASITANQLDGGSSAICGALALSISQMSFDCGDVGPNAVTLTATDDFDNTNTCVANVSVQDNTAPLPECHNITVQLNADDETSITVGDMDTGSGDACGIASVTLSQDAFTCLDVGQNDVTLTAIDVNNNTSTIACIVLVEDNELPEAICQDLTIALDNFGDASIADSDINDGSNDACGIQSTTLSQTTFDCEDLGANSVVLTVMDNNDNFSTCEASVTVQDNITPWVLCGGPVSRNSDAGECGALISELPAPLYGDNCAFIVEYEIEGIPSGALPPYNDQGSGDLLSYFFPVGTAVITYTVTDASGNTGTCSFTVTVTDNEAPEITCPTNINPVNSPGQCQTNVNFAATATDNCEATITYSHAPGSVFLVGTTTVTATATDGAGNATSCSFDISVADEELPQAVCQDITLELDNSGTVGIVSGDVDGGSTDNCAVQSIAIKESSFDCSKVGNNTVVLTVVDIHENSSTCASTVTVEDNLAPDALCNDVTLQLDAAGNASVTSEQLDNGSNDACGIASLTLDQYNFDCANVGANTVIMTATDNHGNTNTCTATVSVEDNTPPIVYCQDVTLQLNSAGEKFFDLQDLITADPSDACGILYAIGFGGLLTCNNVGSFSYTLEARDVNNNLGTCTATITVEDNVAPTAQCMNYAIVVPLDANGQASLTAADIDNGSFDACGIVSKTLNQEDFDCSDVGNQTIVMTVTDKYGNTATCSNTITIADNSPPTATCQDITLQLDAMGNASITANDIDDGSSDACGITSSTLSQSSFDCDDVGDQSVVLTLTDVNGKTATCTGTVTVEDQVNPNAICQDLELYLDQSGNASITADDIDGGSNDACAFSISAAPLNFTTSNVGDNTITLTAIDASGNSSSCLATVNILNRPTSLKYTGDIAVQFSDEVSLSAELTDDLSDQGIQGMTITFTIGTQSTTAVTDASGIASTSMIITQPPTVLGYSYTVTTAFSGTPIYLPASDSYDFTIDQEDARAYFTGALFVSTGGSNSDEATVLLSATIKDITAVNPPDADWDPNAGLIANATVTFINRDNGMPINLTPIPVSPIDATTGTVIYNWPVDIGNADAEEFRIGIQVSNYYTRNSSEEDDIVTVYKPLNDFATGGGYLIMTESSEGVIAGDAGTRSNFGFNIKFNPSGTNLKGRVRALVRRLESDGILHTYQIKGNQMQSLAVDPGGTSAVFTGKANVQDVTDPDNPISLGGNRIFQIEMEDNGEPGSTDLISFSLYATNGTLWYSSNWDGVESTLQLLDGGNLVIHAGSGSNLSAPDNLPEDALDMALQPSETIGLQIDAYPNPFSYKTNIRFFLPKQEQIQLAVFNLNGQQVKLLKSGNLDEGIHQYSWEGTSANGQTLDPGIYLIRLVAREHTIIKKVSLIR